MNYKLLFSIKTLFLLLITSSAMAQYKLSDDASEISPLTQEYVYPVRIVWNEGDIYQLENLLEKGNGQASLKNDDAVILKNTGKDTSSILLDFGKEINGSLEIITGMWANEAPRPVRIRFGESVSEAMSDVGEFGSTNDHAMRDFVMMLPWLGKNQTAETGFRFVRIDFVEPDMDLHLKEIRAIFTYRDIPYLGSFRCDDERLNQIWDVGAYTVHLNMQDFLWDGIKRDRLVWVGDLHPEVSTVNTVFGYNEVVPRSLDQARDVTPLPGWMSGISTYSMWWIIIHHDWYMANGDLNYLQEQKSYLQSLVRQIVTKVKDGKEEMDGNRFLDWPSSEDPEAIHAGLQAMTIMALEKASIISELLEDPETQKLCDQTVASMRHYVPDFQSSKQAAALLSIANMLDADVAYDQVLKIGGAQNFSTFYGYYMLEAMAKAGRYEEAMDIISEYWGGMLDLGATTFWEDFNIEWIENAARIDELVPEGKIDIHGNYGDYCYVGHRHSFCHGWASGPTAWLSEHVLGIKVTKPGGKEYKISPHLGNLEYAEGTYPTPYGLISVKHVKNEDGSIKTEVDAPEEVNIIMQ